MMKYFIIMLVVLVSNGCGAWPAVTDSTEEIFLANEQMANKNQPIRSAVPFIDVLERKSSGSNKTINPSFVSDEHIEETIFEEMSKEAKTIKDNKSDSLELSKRSINEQNTTKIEKQNLEGLSKESVEIVEDLDDAGKNTPEDDFSKNDEPKFEVATTESIDSALEENLDRDEVFPERRMMEGVGELVDRAGEIPEMIPRRLINNPGTIVTRFHNNYEMPNYLKPNRIDRHFLVADPKVNYARAAFII